MALRPIKYGYEETFIASFTGSLSVLGRLRLIPPLRIEKGKTYKLSVAKGSGKTSLEAVSDYRGN